MRKALVTAALALILSGCSSLEFPGAYSLPIDQGNIVTKEMLEQLELGQTKSQVEFILGTPLLVDTFSPQRWDYIYTFRNSERKWERRRLSIWFNSSERLAKVETAGDDFKSSKDEKAKYSTEKKLDGKGKGGKAKSDAENADSAGA